MIQNYADLLWSNFVQNYNIISDKDRKETFHNIIISKHNNNNNNDKLFENFCPKAINYYRYKLYYFVMHYIIIMLISDYIKSLHTNYDLKNNTIVIAAEEIDNNNNNKLIERIFSVMKSKYVKKSKYFNNRNNLSNISMCLKTREIINKCWLNDCK